VAPQPRVAAGEVIRTFNESNKSPYIKRQQTIFHPGEVRPLTWLDPASMHMCSLTKMPDGQVLSAKQVVADRCF